MLYQLSYFRIFGIHSLVLLSLPRLETLSFLRQGYALPTELFLRFRNSLFSIAFPCQGWKPYLYCGKVVLYQLSYFRILGISLFLNVCFLV